MARDEKENENRSCCTWPKIAVMIVAVIAGAVLIWKYAPIDDAIDNILPVFNNTGPDDDDGIGGPSTPGTSPTSSPTAAENFEFMQCQDGTNRCCNGLSTICELRVDEILFASVHNAMATFDDGFLFQPNHLFKLEEALTAGYRGINLDICNCNSDYQSCHGVCGLGSRNLVNVFTSINTFLNDNPTEVVVMPLELNSEVSLPVDIDELFEIMKQVSGFTEKMYVHEDPLFAWPTLSELINLNKRLIVFHYRGTSCGENDECPPGLHWYHRYAIDTPFEFSSVEKIEDTTTSCSFNRNPGNTSKTFFGLNNFVTPPVQASSETLNEYQFAKSRLETCSEQHDGLDVNFIYADFWSVGDLPRLAQEHNANLAARRQRHVRRGT